MKNRDETVDPRLVDQICNEFESQWVAHKSDRPRLVDFVNRFPETGRSEALRQLLAVEIELRKKDGHIPKRETYLRQFPHYESIVDSVILNDDSTVARKVCEPIRTAGRIGKYEIIRELGRGGQAVTFLAHDPDLQRKVVIKEYHSCTTELERNAVLNEGRALARVKSPYVAGCLTVERKGDVVHLVMEYIRGETLQQAGRNKQLSLEKAAQIVARIAEGLYDVHLCGLIHRDIKPANILVASDGSPRIVDFGLAASMVTDERDDLGGTPQFMAPEQAAIDPEKIDQRTDIFGLGATLYWLLTGVVPYVGENQISIWDKVKQGQFDRVTSINPDVPPELEEICQRAMALDPADRYSSALEMANQLRGFCGYDSPKSTHSDTNLENSRIRRNLGPNPYPGLAAFTLKNADNFHGRDHQIERIRIAFLQLLTPDARRSNVPRILPILGPSGSGKSSLAQAGLLANLQRNPPESLENLRSIVVTPGSHPLEVLSGELARVLTDDPSPIGKMREFETELKQPSNNGDWTGLRRIVGLIPDIGSRNICVLVDQFEEVFSLCEDDAERTAFIGNLLHAASDPTAPISFAFTLRTDFIGQTQDVRELNAIIAERGIIVPIMNEDELRAAIAKPARDAGHPLPPSLIDLLISQTIGREGALPLLQFALNQIWEGIVAGEQPNSTLKRIGGVGGALADKAQRIYDSLSPSDQVIAERVFLNLVQLGEGTRDTRRRSDLSNVAADGEQLQEVRRVIDRFSSDSARLITLASRDDGTRTAEITHEALIDHWSSLSEWLNVSRSDLRLQRRLGDAANHWLQEGKPVGLLWRTPDLDLAAELHSRNNSRLSQVERQFYDACVARQTSEQRGQKIRRNAIAIAALAFATLSFLLIILGAGMSKMHKDLKAEAERADTALAEAEIQRGKASHLASTKQLFHASSLFNKSRPLTRCLIDDKEACPELLRGFTWNLLHRQSVLEKKSIEIGRALYSLEATLDGKQLVAGSFFGDVYFINLETMEVDQTVKAHDCPIRSLSFSKDGLTMASVGLLKEVKIWDTTKRQVIRTIEADRVQYASLHPMDGSLLIGSENGVLRRFLADGSEPIATQLVCRGRILEVRHSPTGDAAAVVGDDKSVTLLSSTTLESKWQVNEAHGSWVDSVSFVLDQPQVITGGFDGRIRAWDLANGKMLWNHRAKHSWVNTMPSTSRNDIVVAASLGNSASQLHLWNRKDSRSASFTAHSGPVEGFAYVDDLQTLVSAGSDGFLRFWDLEESANFQDTQPAFFDVAIPASKSFLVRGRQAALLTEDAKLHLIDLNSLSIRTTVDLGVLTEFSLGPLRPMDWNLSTNRLVVGTLEGRVITFDTRDSTIVGDFSAARGIMGIAISPDGKRVAISGSGLKVEIFSLPVGELYATLALVDEVTSVDWSPDGKLVAAGDYENRLTLWEPNADSTLTLTGHSNWILSTVFTPDGTQVVTCGKDMTLRTWDVGTQSTRYTIYRAPSGLNNVCLHPSEQIAATAGEDGIVRIWDLTAGQEQAKFGTTSDAIQDVAFSDNGDILYGLSKEHLYIWSTTDRADILAGMLPSQLSESEEHLLIDAARRIEEHDLAPSRAAEMNGGRGDNK